MHGFESAESIERVSVRMFHVEEGSLYPALQRMLLKGWIAGEWSKTAENRRARYYTVTEAGRRQLEHEVFRYDLAMVAVSHFLGRISNFHLDRSWTGREACPTYV